MFSIWRAIALASKIPTQIGSTRWPSASRRMMMGMFVIGSTIRPLIVISICIVGSYRIFGPRASEPIPHFCAYNLGG